MSWESLGGAGRSLGELGGTWESLGGAWESLGGAWENLGGAWESLRELGTAFHRISLNCNQFELILCVGSGSVLTAWDHPVKPGGLPIDSFARDLKRWEELVVANSWGY